MASYQIDIIPSNQINKTKWNNCIEHAANGLIYGYSFYLDIVSKHWEGLSYNDYEAVMPLTWKSKYGISYLSQPFFTASLGVFGNNLSAKIVKLFLDSIPEKFKYWDIYLNHGNLFPIKEYDLYERNNYVLDMNNNYEKIIGSFSKNHIRNIKKAERSGCYIQKNISTAGVIELAKAQSKKFTSISDNEFKNFLKLSEYLLKQGNAQTYGVYNAQKKLISSCVYFYSHNRAYFILTGNHPDSKTTGASHYLINGFIKEHAGTKLLLDFEGSMIKGVAQFYSKFGAKEEKYAALKLNKLPAVLKLFKK